MAKICDSSVPVTRERWTTRVATINSAFEVTASVSATCRTMRYVATLCRPNAARIGLSCMNALVSAMSRTSWVDLDLPGGLGLRRSPGRVQGGHHRRCDRKQHRHPDE